MKAVLKYETEDVCCITRGTTEEDRERLRAQMLMGENQRAEERKPSLQHSSSKSLLGETLEQTVLGIVTGY